MPRKKPTPAARESSDPPRPLVEISQEEQWRLINQTGILHKVKETSDSDNEGLPLGEEIFNASLFIIPASFLLILMEILTYHQYGQEVNWKTVIERITSGVPILAVFVFFTIRYKRNPRMQLLLFLIGTAAGSRMLFLLKRAGYLVNMRQTPPLITLWVYTVIQMDLGLAVSNLLFVAAFCWWKGLKLFD